LPSKDAHIKKAERNEKFAEFLASKTHYLDWAITVLFYAALHYVDAVLAVSLADPEDHKERKAQMAVNETLKRVYREYRIVETASWNSRYFTMPIDSDDWNKVKPEFDALRGHIRNRLKI
jgi:bisphosphoglycerate-independent phosphoglycerate mutase (AlkP superfamily)